MSILLQSDSYLKVAGTGELQSLHFGAVIFLQPCKFSGVSRLSASALSIKDS